MVVSARILLVDEDPASVGRLRAALPAYDCEILTATVATALTVAGQAAPELILVSALPRDAGGLNLCRRLKADTDLVQVPVLLIACRDDLATLEEGFASGADDCLARPS